MYRALYLAATLTGRITEAAGSWWDRRIARPNPPSWHAEQMRLPHYDDDRHTPDNTITYLTRHHTQPPEETP